jgi:hypothetical protein
MPDLALLPLFPSAGKRCLMPNGMIDQRATGRSKQIPAETKPNPIERLHRYLDAISTEGFFGKVSVSFQNGKVHDIKVEQTRKLEDL